jgi:hypothetical protein
MLTITIMERTKIPFKNFVHGIIDTLVAKKLRQSLLDVLSGFPPLLTTCFNNRLKFQMTRSNRPSEKKQSIDAQLKELESERVEVEYEKHPARHGIIYS